MKKPLSIQINIFGVALYIFSFHFLVTNCYAQNKKIEKISMEKLEVRELKEFKIDTPFSFHRPPKIDSINGKPVYFIDGTREIPKFLK
jgi:hypothetical protein